MESLENRDTPTAARTKRKSLRTIYLPCSSPVANFIFDELLCNSDVPHTTICVLMFLLRRTVGWSNRCDEVSLSQIESGASVSRPVAIHAVRVICEVWGLFHKSRGQRGQHSSIFTIGDLTADGFNERSILIEGLYGTVHPASNQLRETPCTKERLAWERRKLAEERAQHPS